MNPTDYVAQLIARLQAVAGDPQKCAEVMAHDERDGTGVNDLLLCWEEEQWEKDHPEEVERLWESSTGDLKGMLEKRLKELKGPKKGKKKK